jgi:hypothetical protein
MFNDRTKFNSIKKLCQAIVIELGDDNDDTECHDALVNVSQQSEVNGLYMPTFQISLLSIPQFDTAGYTSTFGRGKCSISSTSITITGYWVNDLDIISPATAHTSTVPSLPTKSPSTKKEKQSIIVPTSRHPIIECTHQRAIIERTYHCTIIERTYHRAIIQRT